nr:hypothetical protein Iba_chr04dCG2570 [Ipomoea batatas]
MHAFTNSIISHHKSTHTSIFLRPITYRSSSQTAAVLLVPANVLENSVEEESLETLINGNGGTFTGGTDGSGGGVFRGLWFKRLRRASATTMPPATDAISISRIGSKRGNGTVSCAMTAEAARSLFQVADTPDTLPAPPPLVDEFPPLPEVFPDVVPPPISMDGIIPLGPVQSIAEEIVEPPIIA